VAAVPAGTVGVVNVCCAPFLPATGVNVIPAGGVHVYVRDPPAGPVANASAVTLSATGVGSVSFQCRVLFLTVPSYS
jgi:hypothetical protein